MKKIVKKIVFVLSSSFAILICMLMCTKVNAKAADITATCKQDGGGSAVDSKDLIVGNTYTTYLFPLDYSGLNICGSSFVSTPLNSGEYDKVKYLTHYLKSGDGVSVQKRYTQYSKYAFAEYMVDKKVDMPYYCKDYRTLEKGKTIDVTWDEIEEETWEQSIKTTVTKSASLKLALEGKNGDVTLGLSGSGNLEKQVSFEEKMSSKHEKHLSVTESVTAYDSGVYICQYRVLCEVYYIFKFEIVYVASTKVTNLLTTNRYDITYTPYYKYVGSYVKIVPCEQRGNRYIRYTDTEDGSYVFSDSVYENIWNYSYIYL